MSSKLTTTATPDDDDLSKMTNDELMKALADCLGRIAEQIVVAVKLVTLALARGIDISKIRNGWMVYIRRIVAQKLLPEALQRFGRTRVCDAIGRLPHAEQLRLANGEMVPLVVYREEKRDVRNADPSELLPEQIQQVFAPDHIRTYREQELWLENQHTRKELPKRISGVNLEKGFYTKEQLLAIIAKLE